jgi:hypothetical protein
MQLLKLSNKSVEIYSITGKVVSVKQRNQSHIHASGGGGTIINGTGNIRDISISTSNTHHQEIFIEDMDGLQHPVQLTNWNLPFIEGNVLTVVWIMEPGDKVGPYVLIQNHSTNQYAILDDKIKSFSRVTFFKTLGFLLIVANLIAIFFAGKLGVYIGTFAAIGLSPLVWQATHIIKDFDAIREGVFSMVRNAKWK